MKLLMFYAPQLWVKTHSRTLPTVDDYELEKTYPQAVVIFYHAEAEDVGREPKVVSKWVKNAKWLAGKFVTKNIVLHSFNHLSQSKAPVEATLAIVSQVRERLQRSSFMVFETPFGYQNEWKMHVSGESLAKVFKEI